MKLTIKITKGKNLLIGQFKEIPAVLTQGNTVEEVQANIMDALELYLADMRQVKTLESDILIKEVELTY
ncbi:MAG: type II toxin-antitoxin system HicB family antitoxin [bacterium]|nr:type II toxin-antitoxin system HicB family antitoxin [bacterium]